MIDLIASILGMCGSALNMNLSHRLQIFGIVLWLVSDIILVWYLWSVSLWITLMYCFYICTCSIGIYKRWGLK